MFDGKMLGMLTKQLLMASGVKEPEVYEMISALCKGGFDAPTIEAYGGDSLPILPGSKAVAIMTSSDTEELQFLIVRRTK